MPPDRKHPSAAFWATVVVVVGLLYIASFGPACWWWSEDRYMNVSGEHRRMVSRFYVPIGWTMQYGPRPVAHWLGCYATLHAPFVVVPCKWNGREGVVAGDPLTN